MSKSETLVLYDTFKEHMQRLADVKNAIALLEWDQETYMPAGGAQFRGQQLTTLADLAHRMSTRDEFGQLMEKLLDCADLPELERKNVELTYEDYQKKRKYPADLVKALTRTYNTCFMAWIQARRENRFAIFAPELEKMIALKQREAETLGYPAQPYDALLDQHERGLTTATLEQIFPELKTQIISLLSWIQQRPQPSDACLHAFADKQQQWDFGIYLLQSIGFDFQTGRQDLSVHPFTTSFNPHDVRVTTRIHENQLSTLIWSCIHEGGHALYEQGLPVEQYGLPAGKASSLVIHESQSRLWENCIGRSLPFWTYHYPELQKRIPIPFREIDLVDFYKAINLVKPSLIRTEADELTYHLHILIRYEIEKKLINEKLPVKELPELWNALYADMLGVQVPDDLHGILQDIHWCHGSLGYFPTYTLGSLLAAQWWQQLQHDIADLDETLARGHTRPVLDWLRSHIHCYGSLYTADELCLRVTGKPLQVEAFLDYAREKFTRLYA